MRAPLRTSTTALATSLVIAAAMNIPVSFVGAQQPGRGPVSRESRGILKSIDVKTRAVTIITNDPGQTTSEKSLTLAADAEIALADGSARRTIFQAGRIEDLVAGTSLTLTLSADEKTCTAVLAQGPLVRGVLKSVDVAKQEVVVVVVSAGRDQSAAERVYKLTPGSEIGVDDGRGRRYSVREAKFADLISGAGVMLQLSPNQKDVQSVVAEGPTLMGTVKSVDAGSRKLTMVVNPPRSDEKAGERTLEVAADAVLGLDDGRGHRLSVTLGKLSDVPTGSVVRVRLSGDQRQAVQVVAEGPSRAGVIKSIDAAKRTITVAIFVAPEEQPEEKTLPVSVDARITIDNKTAKLEDIHVAENGTFAGVRLSLDQKAIHGITIVPSR